ncbi:hypothetical protein [Sodalis sp. dw_96]|uniref:hypothetical protein n=1 Tax=Sodalis sp. dw_96 TaxID=2719794 RepID=UPI001BD394CB|nr:hypothetical protein [Sodalis sp. dw_96]
MKSVSIPAFGMRIAAYAIIDKRNNLNRLVNRISGGSVNRDTLAKKIVSDMITLGQDVVVNSELLGKRSADIVNLSRSVTFDNTFQQVEAGVAPLIKLIMQSKGHSVFAQRVASDIMSFLGPSLLKDHALERVLAALAKQEGGENVLKLALDNVLSGFTGGKILSSPLMSALKRAILDNTEFQETSYLHTMAAWKLHQFLTPDSTLLPDPPLGLTLAETAIETGIFVATEACRQLDNLQKALNITPGTQKATDLFTECWPSDLAVAENITAKNFANIVIAAKATNQENILDTHLAALPDGVRTALQQQCNALRGFLARLPAAEIKVAQNWSGGLEFIILDQTSRHPPSADLIKYGEELKVPVHMPAEHEGTMFDESFLNAFKSGIDFNIDDSQQGYTQWIRDFGARTIYTAKSHLGYQGEFTEHQKQQLHKLSLMVDGNPMSMLAMTRYLIPDSIAHSLEDRLLNQFERQLPDLVYADNLWMKIDKPKVSFSVDKDNTVNINATLTWPISHYGRTTEVLRPVEENAGSITSTVQIRLLCNEKGVENQDIIIKDTRIDLKDKWTVEASPNLTLTAGHDSMPLELQESSA